jgi:hypothetical protein
MNTLLVHRPGARDNETTWRFSMQQELHGCMRKKGKEVEYQLDGEDLATCPPNPSHISSKQVIESMTSTSVSIAVPKP